MKIYHTETQADYDALMVELEEQGCKWASGRKPTESKDWVDHKEKTGVVIEKRITRAYIGKLKFEYPNIPIIKYKAKADEKMKFTKENVKRVIDEYFCQADFEPCGDLIAEIPNLDDTPEKVVVPKFVADEIAELGEKFLTLRDVYDGNVNFLCQGTNFLNGEELKLARWVNENGTKFERAWLNGYTIEPEQLYYIPLPDLEMLDGTQQVLSKRKNGNRYFASRPNENLKQRFTKDELAQVPVSYKPFAKPIEEEEE